MPLTATDFYHLYRFVENRPTAGIDFLGLGIWEMSFTPSEAHGSIERYRPPFWPWSLPYEQLAASKGSPASKPWGSVTFDYSVAGSTFSASVSAMTDFSKAPSDTTQLAPSASIEGDVKVKACCGSKKVDISWSAHGAQDLGLSSQVKIESSSFITTTAIKSFMQPGTLTLNIGSLVGEASFHILVLTVWRDVPPSTTHQTGVATLSATVACHYD